MSDVDMDRVREKATEIVRLLDGMEKREAFGALTLAVGQSLKHLCAGPTFEEALAWVKRNIEMISREPADKKDLN